MIAIVAHVDRVAVAGKLAERTETGYIAYDDGTLGCTANHQHVWQHHADHVDGDWAVTLEDDAKPVDDFLSQLSAALAMAPTPIVSLYLGTGRPLAGWQHQIKQTIREARRTNACWITSTHLLHAVGVAIRTPLLPSLTQGLTELFYLPVDEAITMWARHHGHTIGYTWPSLVDHADLPTLVDHADGKTRRKPRVAWQTGTRDEWNAKPVVMRSPHAKDR